MRSADVVFMPPERHLPADPLAELREQDGMVARMQGERTRMLGRVAAEGEGNEFLAEQVAVELGCSPNTARNRLWQARRLCERLPGTVDALCDGRIDHFARAARGHRDDRPMDAVRADTVADLLTGHDGGADIAVRVNVTVDAVTLAGLSDEPGDLAGYGPLDAATARALSGDATWRRLLTDPARGSVLDIGRRSYRPPAALAEHVIRRDATCRFPGCPRRAASCDLDHTTGWQIGGATSSANLGALCRRHHRLKTDTDWRLSQPAPGTFCWRSPRGTTHSTEPVRLTDPDPP